MADDFDFSNLFNITYDANGNMLFNGAPLANTPPVNLDNTDIFNSAGQAYVPAGASSGTGGNPTLDVDYTDAIAMLNSPFANTAVFDSSDLDGFDDVTGDPSLFEDMLLQGADTRIGLNEAANTLPSNQSSTVDGGAGNDVLEGPPAPLDVIPTTYTTAQDLLGPVLSGDNLGGRVIQNMQDNEDGTFSFVLNDGALVTYDNQGNIVSSPDLESYQYDGTGPFIIRDNIDLYDATSDTFGNTSIDDIVTFLNSQGLGSVGQQFKNQLGSMSNAQQIEDSFFNQDMAKRSAFRNLLKDFDLGGYLNSSEFQTIKGLQDAAIASSNNNTTTDTTTNTGPNYEDLYGNLANEYQRLLDQQNQPSNQTGSGDMSGLMGLLNQFMQSRNSLQGGGRYNNMYGTMYGGGMGYGSPYGNPFNSGMGYGYGMNPYSGGIGSFYGNTGLGFSPSGYNSGYGSGYGMNNMFYGGFGGNNYNQQQQMAYNPYSSLYNQLSNPQTYGYSGDVYTPEYNSYLNTQYEGDRYSQGYQDYLQSNNPGVYNNLFGGSV
tara:strand:- start:1991 stop:3616 length:1626 start_codon:yes stop_codon:yes gene_type:complete